MTVSIPFDRHDSINSSINLDRSLYDAIDHMRVAENGERPLSRSAMVRELLRFAISLLTDERAIAEFVAEHTAKVAPRMHPEPNRRGAE